MPVQLLSTNAFSANACSLNVSSTFTAIHSPFLVNTDNFFTYFFSKRINISKMTSDLLGSNGVNRTAQGFSVEYTMTDDSYFNISEIKLFSVKIMSHLGASEILYSDVIYFRDIKVRVVSHCILD